MPNNHENSYRQSWRERYRSHPHSHRWHSKRRFFFRRFLRFAFLLSVLVLGVVAVLSFIFTRLFGGDGQTAFAVWAVSCGLLLALPALAMGISMRAYQRVATPIVNMMTALDSVAEGDLSVRVPDSVPGEFGRLASSFNRMTAELERTDQQRRNLTADVAHELRTPLHIIQGNLEGILDGVYEPTAEHINATLDETRALSRLIGDLRTLSLAESGQLPLVKEPVDIGELLVDLETSFSGQTEAAGVTFSVQAAQNPHPLVVLSDAGRLDQVLSNLVVNALRHTPAGGTITLQAKSVEDRIRITLQDSGEGIAAEDLPYIFDRFWRGDRARSHTGGVGGGLGLAIAQQLIQAHGGQINVDSQLGVGTTFTIELPTATDHHQPATNNQFLTTKN